MKIIDLEAHFLTQEYAEFSQSRKMATGAAWAEDILPDLGERRLESMDAAGIDVQVLSLGSPHLQLLEASEGTNWSRKINNELSAAVKEHSDRFVGLAALAPQSPGEAADELERAVTELGSENTITR